MTLPVVDLGDDEFSDFREFSRGGFDGRLEGRGRAENLGDFVGELEFELFDAGADGCGRESLPRFFPALLFIVLVRDFVEFESVDVPQDVHGAAHADGVVRLLTAPLLLGFGGGVGDGDCVQD